MALFLYFSFSFVLYWNVSYLLRPVLDFCCYCLINRCEYNCGVPNRSSPFFSSIPSSSSTSSCSPVILISDLSIVATLIDWLDGRNYVWRTQKSFSCYSSSYYFFHLSSYWSYAKEVYLPFSSSSSSSSTNLKPFGSYGWLIEEEEKIMEDTNNISSYPSSYRFCHYSVFALLIIGNIIVGYSNKILHFLFASILVIFFFLWY